MKPWHEDSMKVPLPAFGNYIVIDPLQGSLRAVRFVYHNLSMVHVHF